MNIFVCMYKHVVNNNNKGSVYTKYKKNSKELNKQK